MRTYKLLNNTTWLQRDDGTFVNPIADEYVQWIAGGNTPLAADPLPPPIDYSDINNLEKGFKALALCVAQVGGLTVSQMKALFKSKWNSL